MDIINKVDWIPDLKLDLLKDSATLPFSLGDFKSLYDILTTLKVGVILEPGVIELQDYTILKKNLEYWEEEAARLRKREIRDAYSEELYQEALRNIEELNYELRVCPKHLARGVYWARKNVIILYPDEMLQEYDGQRMDELLVSTLATIQNKQEVCLFNRNISRQSVNKAVVARDGLWRLWLLPVGIQ